MILAIDPGNVESAYCLMDEKTYKAIEFGKIDNHELLIKIGELKYDKMAIEMIASYGMAVGQTVFETCVWIGRFIQRRTCPDYNYIYRKDEKMCLCHSMKANDSTIRQALIDRFGEVGVKANPGWFYKFKKDIWAAYAVGVVFIDKEKGIYE